MAISRLQKVQLRELWAHEAHGFTKWLAENIDFLGEALNLELTLIEREAAAGPFTADILAEDSDGNYVIIENQLEQTDHDHLGKLITYLSNLEAKKAVWITRAPRPEHEKAIHWLNEVIPADTAFYLIKLEAYRIDQSAPAPLLSIVAGPSTESKRVGIQKKELAERHILRLEFWKGLLERAKTIAPSLANRTPSKDNWISVGAGKSGFSYSYVIRMEDAHIELYIDVGEADRNKQLFDTLATNKDDIQRAFGKPLEWQRLDEKRGCRIRHVFSSSGLSNQERWPELQQHMLETMVSFQRVFREELNKLR